MTDTFLAVLGALALTNSITVWIAAHFYARHREIGRELTAAREELDQAESDCHHVWPPWSKVHRRSDGQAIQIRHCDICNAADTRTVPH